MAHFQLNSRAARVAASAVADAKELRIGVSETHGATLLDFGVDEEGGLEAGVVLARICLSDLADVSLVPGGNSVGLPEVFVRTDHPVEACLLSQYAGWKIATSDFFAMGSGSMRSLARRELLFDDFETHEDRRCCVGVLEASRLPTHSAIDFIRDAVGHAGELTLVTAPTSSQAGTLQVVARSVETAMHKLHDVKFPVTLVISAAGTAPLPPVAKNDLEGIGRTNDAILYGSTVSLWVRCDDSLIETVGPSVPSSASKSHGQPFLKLFEAANYDFYALDPALFSPAVVVFHNLRSGRSFRFGDTNEGLLRESFGISN
ncbi:MAG: methenyltetrahydromethanopterin cyclohydrolase [Planctomycetaceae bacterium]